MKKSSFSIPMFLVVLGFAGTSIANDCVISYDRTACKGQEATSYKKCDGNKTCDKAKKADSEAACQAAALKSCANDRLDITKSKIITAKFKGQALVGGFNAEGVKDAAGMNFCDGASPEFNKCPQ